MVQKKPQTLEDRLNNAQIAELRLKHGLTGKQAAYVLEVLKDSRQTESAMARKAGYTDTTRKTDSGRVIRSPTIKRAVRAEREEIERKAKELDAAITRDARGTIQNELAEHAKDPEVMPNQTRALELLGKMHGVFVDRVEVDVSLSARASLAGQIIPSLRGETANPSQENE